MQTTLDNFYTFQTRFEIRDAVFGLLNTEIKNDSPLIVEYGESVDLEGDGRKTCGSVLFTRKWKSLMGELGFDQQSSSSEGWSYYRLQGKKDIVCNAILTEIRCHSNRTIIHSIVISLINTANTENPIITAYTGNIEDFGNKVIKKMRNARLNEKYGL
jgi:hypothetical protein